MRQHWFPTNAAAVSRVPTMRSIEIAKFANSARLRGGRPLRAWPLSPSPSGPQLVFGLSRTGRCTLGWHGGETRTSRCPKHRLLATAWIWNFAPERSGVANSQGGAAEPRRRVK